MTFHSETRTWHDNNMIVLFMFIKLLVTQWVIYESSEKVNTETIFQKSAMFPNIFLGTFLCFGLGGWSPTGYNFNISIVALNCKFVWLPLVRFFTKEKCIYLWTGLCWLCGQPAHSSKAKVLEMNSVEVAWVHALNAPIRGKEFSILTHSFA